MSGSRKFIIGIVVFLVLVFIAEMNMPQRYRWIPTFRHDDRQPFGAYVADSLLKASMPRGYEVVDKTLYQLAQDSVGEQPNIVIVSYEPVFTETDMRALRRMLNQGRKLLLIGSVDSDSPFAKEFFLAAYANDYFSPIDFKQFFKADNRFDSIEWRGRSHPRRRFDIYPHLNTGYVEVYVPTYDIDSLAELSDDPSYRGKMYAQREAAIADSLHIDTLLTETVELYDYDSDVPNHYVFEDHPKAASIRVGKGELIVCPMIFLYTNFSILDDHTRDLVFRLLSQVGDRPVVRTESYLNTASADDRNSPLSFFLNRPPLRWAVYLGLAGVLLYFFFTARRRQRVIPVVKDPDNKSLEFVRLIGTLYYHQHDNTDLVRKKYMYFAERLRRMTMVDIESDDDDGSELLAEYLGMPHEEVASRLGELRAAIAVEGNLPDKQMRRCIDLMDEMTASILDHSQ